MVDFNQVLPDPNDLLVGSSIQSISFKDAKVGDSFTGIITNLRTVEVRNYEDPTKIETWDDGKPKLQIEVTLATEYADGSDPEDDGSRRVFLFGQKLRAAQETLRKMGVKKLPMGSKFTITLSGTKPSTNKRYNDVKLYTIDIEPSDSNPAVDALLSIGATPVSNDTIEKLTDKQLKVAETLQANGFTSAEIAENLGVSVAAVDSVLTF
jgi:hypothetical protein